MISVKAPHVEPIPGYRLVEPLGKGGFGEVWKCEAPGGLFKAIKFIHGGDPFHDPTGVAARQELRALQLVKSIRHPFLLSIERIEIVEGEVLIVMELADRSLHDLLVEYRAAGKAGIPRGELLRYLRDAADAIDVLNQEHGLQHLDIKPRNLFLSGRHVKVADFGLVISLGDLQTQKSWLRRSESVTPLYAAPESFLGRFTLFSDQYSFAVTYQELSTGSLPITGRNFRQLAMNHVQKPPDLESLPEAERPILARALAKEPRERFSSCGAFIEALLALNLDPSPASVRSHGTRTDLDLGALAATPTGTREVRTIQPSAAAAVSPPPSEGETPNDPAAFLAGLHLLECVHRHAAVEVWKAQTSDGRKRLVKLINGYHSEEERPGGDPLRRLRAIQHACLPPLEIQRGFGDRLALIAEEPDGSLGDRLRECRQLGQPGIPRPELLGYLRQAAEALDALYQQHRLQHLCLSPRQLVLRAGRLALLDFALVELLWLPAGHQPAALNTRYAAPELFEQQISRHCDQYSLALIYQELLTGIHAFRNFNPRQMALARLRGKPDLGMLPGTDRPIVAQALHLDPDRRFPNCSAFVEALAQVPEGRGLGSSHQGTQVQHATVSVPIRGAGPRSATDTRAEMEDLHWDCSPAEMKQIIAEQLAVADVGEVRACGPLRYRLLHSSSDMGVSPGKHGDGIAVPSLEHFAFGRLAPSTARLKLAGFEEEWQLQPLLEEKNAATRWSYQLSLGGSFWQRWRGRSPRLLVQIDLRVAPFSTESLAEVILRVRPGKGVLDPDLALLEDIGMRLLRSLRHHLQLPPERRVEDRIDLVQNVRVRPLYSEREIGEAFAAQLRDLSPGGMGLELPCRPPCDYLLVELCPPHRTPIIVPVQGMYAHARGEGRHRLGARFAWEIVQRFRS